MLWLWRRPAAVAPIKETPEKEKRKYQGSKGGDPVKREKSRWMVAWAGEAEGAERARPGERTQRSRNRHEPGEG